jgi:hypothetical protein
MHRLGLAASLLVVVPTLVPDLAIAQGRFPPDSLINVQVLPEDLTPIQVIGQMRNYTGALGVRCQYCHVGEEGRDLATFDFVSDDKRPKRVAREMIRMVQMINGRLDSLPGREADGLQVTCNTCHRGVTRPVPLSTLLADVARSSGADSAVRAYRGLRERYNNSGAYDFREGSVNSAAFALATSMHFAEALVLLDFNETLYPNSSVMSVFRGNILLRRGDTTAAATAFREAIRRDSSNSEARGRLRTIGRQP